MQIAEIWRYPVKSMVGEQLQSARLTNLGIDGDRVIHIRNAQGRLVTSRTRLWLLGFHASLDSLGQPVVGGTPWSDPSIITAIRKIVGPGAQLVRDEGPERFDVLPLLVATDGAIAAFGRDHRRLRPNLVIGGVKGLDERNWPGKRLIVGDVVIRVEDLRGRSIMTTFDPDTLAHDPNVLRDIVKRFAGKLALNCEVIQGGTISLEQEATLIGGK
jgi:uncharacterized protein YcbX